MAKKRKESRARARAESDDEDEDGWMTRDEGWNAVDVNSSALMLGATEDGFMSLEVLDLSLIHI